MYKYLLPVILLVGCTAQTKVVHDTEVIKATVPAVELPQLTVECPEPKYVLITIEGNVYVAQTLENKQAQFLCDLDRLTYTQKLKSITEYYIEVTK